MSAVALILNLLLGGLLLAALGLGWRLDRRLKALRDSQVSFSQAVADLDRAATRAEQGLADLRAATDEAKESLAGRIDRAQQLAARLDGTLARAPTAAAPSGAASPTFTQEAAEARAERIAARLELGLSRDEPARGRAEPRQVARPESRLDMRPEPRVRTDLILEDTPGRRPFAATPAMTRAGSLPPAPPPQQRSRARVDDDLFADADPRRAAALGARR